LYAELGDAGADRVAEMLAPLLLAEAAEAA